MEYANNDSRLRIGYLMQTGAPDLDQVSGPQLHTTAVINGLKKLGHTVLTVATQKSKLGWSEDLVEWRAPRFGVTKNILFRFVESAMRRIQTELGLPFLGLFDDFHFADACRQQLSGSDILYERHGYMGFGGVIASRWLRIPLILELNGNILKEIDQRELPMSRLQRKIGRWITIRTFLAADRMVVVSDALRHTLVHDYHIPAGKISVVLNGVDIGLFSRQYDDVEIRSRFGLGPAPMIGFVGTFEPWHGVDLLVLAFREVAQRHPDVQLVIIGEGSGKEKAIAVADQLGLSHKVRFLGRLQQPQVAAVLSSARVLVAPYPFEYGDIVGTPLKIMEYMATGRGIVASSTPLHEMIEHEVTGLRVAPANAQALAAGINRLLEDDELCNRVGHNAAARAPKYAWDQVSMKLADIFVEEIDKLMKTHGRRKPN